MEQLPPPRVTGPTVGRWEGGDRSEGLGDRVTTIYGRLCQLWNTQGVRVSVKENLYTSEKGRLPHVK